MDQLARIHETILSDDITYFFCAVIVVWLALAAFLVLVRRLAVRPVTSKFIAMTPNSLAMLGVLGTFTGILIGLLNFDVTRIDDSVPELLAGLKIAFTTSIVGIAAAISFRLVRTIAPSGASSEGVTPENIHAALLEIRDDGRTTASRSADQLTELRKAISSEGDSSLLTQVQNGNLQCKSEIWKSFSISEFLMEYSTFFRSQPGRKDTSAELNNYVHAWPRISEQTRRAAQWRCEKCQVDLSEMSGSLHCHHKNGVVTDNNSRNLAVLCALCHAEQPAHQHMKVSPTELKKINRLRSVQGIKPA